MALFGRKKAKPAQEGEKKERPMLLRCVAIVTVFLLVAGALGLRLAQLQVDEAAEWEALASRQQLASVTLEPLRGNIYDSNLKLLAQSATVWTVEASPDVLNRYLVDKDTGKSAAPRVAAQELARILGVDEEVLFEKLSNVDSKYYKIKAKIEKPIADEIREMCKIQGIGGIYLSEDTKRYYPYDDLASTILGFVGADNNGLEGLERWYEEILAGTPGRAMQLIDARGNEIYTGDEGTTYPAEDGQSIVLTLNTEMQASVDKHLQEAVDKYNPKQRGFAIAMDVNTGAILALSVYPSYNPNEPYEIQDAATQSVLEMLPAGSQQYIDVQGAARTLQWRNKALADTYEPGSVLKIITAAAALDSGTYTQEDCFTCGGSISIEGWHEPMRCAGDPPTNHGTPSLRTALIESCNVAFIRMSAGMGKSTWYSYLRAFGLTEPTGVDLPGEPSQSAMNNLVYNEERMGAVELASCSFGQSNKYTAVQMITAISAAVNGGNLMQPYIVDRVLDASGNVINQTQPTVKRQVISPETSAQICNILEELVHGTTNGRHAYVAGYQVGGKSGTSQKLDLLAENEENKQYISSFVGFAPANDPQIAVLMVLDEPKDTTGNNFFGGRLVGPSVGNILRDCLDIMGIEPSYTTDAEKARDTEKVPKCVDNSVSGARTLLNQKNLTAYVVGGGDTVIGQMPAAYSDIPYGGEVVLYTDASLPQEMVTVPDVSGKTAAAARDLLRGMGLNVMTDGAPDDGSGVVVVSQDLEAGTSVPRGSIVTLKMQDTSSARHD